MKAGSIVKIWGDHIPVGNFHRSQYAGKIGLVVSRPPKTTYYHVLLGSEIQIFTEDHLIKIKETNVSSR